MRGFRGVGEGVVKGGWGGVVRVVTRQVFTNVVIDYCRSVVGRPK